MTAPTLFADGSFGERLPRRTPPPQDASPQNNGDSFWLVRYRGPIFFFLIVFSLAGIYAAEQVPISVFPETNFPRVVIGVDNGVMPVEQMQVTITKPIEDAVNSVPGLVTVRSTTSRGSAEVSLFFDWSVDMYQTLQLVDAAISRVRQITSEHRNHYYEPAYVRDLSRFLDTALPQTGFRRLSSGSWQPISLSRH